MQAKIYTFTIMIQTVSIRDMCIKPTYRIQQMYRTQ